MEEEAILEEGNCLELLLLLIKSFLLLDVMDCGCVLGLYGCLCLVLDDLGGTLGILKCLDVARGFC